MALSPQELNLKRWKRKFLGVTEEGIDAKEDIYSKAQKLINIFRQLSVLNKASVEKYNEMLLHISPDIRSVLSSLPCGSDVRGYISYLQEKKGLPIIEDEEEDASLDEERKKAKILADAISQSNAENAANMQEQAMKQVETLTKSLLEAQNKNASTEDIAKITEAIAKAQSSAVLSVAQVAPSTPLRKVKKIVKDENGEEKEVETDEFEPYYPPPVAPLVGTTDAATAIGNAVADAIIKSQQQTSEIISKMLGDAISKPERTQSDNLKGIAEMLADSQEKTAKIILDSVGDAISKPQQTQNNNIKELAQMLAQNNENNMKAISASLKEALTAPSTQEQTSMTQIAALITQGQEKTAQMLADSFKEVLLKNDEVVPANSDNNPAFTTLLETQNENARILNEILNKLSDTEIVKEKSNYFSKQTKEEDEKTSLAQEVKSEPSVDYNVTMPLYGDYDENEFVSIATEDNVSPLSVPLVKPSQSSSPSENSSKRERITSPVFDEKRDELKLEPTSTETESTEKPVLELTEEEPLQDELNIPFVDAKTPQDDINDTIQMVLPPKPTEPVYQKSLPEDLMISKEQAAEDSNPIMNVQYEYEYFELDEKGNLVPFDPTLNPDVKYEVIEDIYTDKTEIYKPDEILTTITSPDIYTFPDVYGFKDSSDLKTLQQSPDVNIDVPVFNPVSNKNDNFDGLFKTPFSLQTPFFADTDISLWTNEIILPSAQKAKQDDDLYQEYFVTHIPTLDELKHANEFLHPQASPLYSEIFGISKETENIHKKEKLDVVKLKTKKSKPVKLSYDTKALSKKNEIPELSSPTTPSIEFIAPKMLAAPLLLLEDNAVNLKGTQKPKTKKAKKRTLIAADIPAVITAKNKKVKNKRVSGKRKKGLRTYSISPVDES